MTCIIGATQGDEVLLGADSAVTNGWLDQQTTSYAKVFKRGNVLLGVVGSLRLHGLLLHNLVVPGNGFADIHTDFVNAVRTCLTEGGLTEKINGAEKTGSFIVGWRGQLFRYFDDNSTHQQEVPFVAMGCGDTLAVGSLYRGLAAEEPRQFADYEDMKGEVDFALDAACEFSAGCRGPYHYVILGRADDPNWRGGL